MYTMLRTRILIAVSIIIFLSGCALLFPVGDSAVRVKGEIVNNNHNQRCSISLRLVSSEEILVTNFVDSKFINTFIISPKTNNYFFTIQCGDKSNVFRSQAYKLGSYEHYRTPIDLGKIQM